MPSHSLSLPSPAERKRDEGSGGRMPLGAGIEGRNHRQVSSLCMAWPWRFHLLLTHWLWHSAPLPPPDSLFGPPPPLETTTGGSPGPQDPIGGSSNLLAPVSSSTVSYVNHSHATYYPTDLYSGYPVASVFSAAGAQKTALQPTRQRTKARSNAGNLRPDLLTCYYCTE